MNILFLVQIAAFISMAGIFGLSIALFFTPISPILALYFLGFGLLNLVFSAFLFIPEIIIIKNNWETFKTWSQTQKNWTSENQTTPLYTGKWYAIFTEFVAFKKTLIQKGLLSSKIGIVSCFTTEKENKALYTKNSVPMNKTQLEEIA